MLDPKNSLVISLTEPVIFLRSSDPSGRVQTDPNDPPTLVRGILTLNVVKPIEISSIEVGLTGMLTVSCPEGIGPRRVEILEKQKIYSSSLTVFHAYQVPHRIRPASVGRLSTASSNDGDEHAGIILSCPPPSRRGRSERRSAASVPIDLGPTPPYTPVAQSPNLIQSRPGAPGENPAQTLEELRQALRYNLEGQTYRNGSIPMSSRPDSNASSLVNPTMHSSASSASNCSLDRENDDHSDDMAHTSHPFESDTSVHSTAEEPPHILHHCTSPSRLSHVHSLENTHGTQPRIRCDSSTSRSRLRLSLSSVLGAVAEITSRAPSRSQSVAGSEEMERGRTRARTAGEQQSREGVLGVGEGVAGTGNRNQLGANGHMEQREHPLLGLGRFLGLERGHEKEKDGAQKTKEYGEGWREFKPGTYSYPISFLLPTNLPPTFSVLHGSLNYTIKGVAHRPGTFTSKLSCKLPLLVVAAPTVDAGEGTGTRDPGPLFVQKQWEGKLAYSFGLSSRLFHLGSQRHLEVAANEGIRADTEPPVEAEVEARAEGAYGAAILDLILLPLEKIKIWRLSVVVDQRIRYADEQGKLFRDDDHRRVRLLEVQDTCPTEQIDLVDEEEQTHKNKRKNKHDFVQIPLLPTPISPHRSPLLRYLSPSTDPSILMGPGPYTLSTSIGLPGCNHPSCGDSGLHFTVKQKSSGVRIEHSLRLIMRVERVGDEGTDDHEEGDRKRLFDITVQTPITILSCRCVPEFQTLPRYSQTSEDSLQDRPACPCQPSIVGSTEQGHRNEIENQLGHVMTPSSASSFESEDGVKHFHRQADEQRNGHEGSGSSSSCAARSGHPSPLTMPVSPHPPSPVSRAGWSRSADAQTHSHGQPHHSHSQSYSSTSHLRTQSQTPPILTLHPSRPPSPLARYERLVSGLESEAGEAPPSYESIASSF